MNPNREIKPEKADLSTQDLLSALAEWFKHFDKKTVSAKILNAIDLKDEKVIRSEIQRLIDKMDAQTTAVSRAIAAIKIPDPLSSVRIENLQEMPTEVAISNFPKQEIPTEIRVNNLSDIVIPPFPEINFPEFPKFPEVKIPAFPKSFEISNLPEVQKITGSVSIDSISELLGGLQRIVDSVNDVDRSMESIRNMPQIVATTMGSHKYTAASPMPVTFSGGIAISGPVTISDPIAVTQSGTWTVAVAGTLDIRSLSHTTDSIKVGDGVDTIAILADGADALTNATNQLVTGSFIYGFNGTTWDRLPATTADGLLVNLGANNDVTITSGTITTVSTVTSVTAIANALPAGTNAIGKLTANSGVDIGDVDVTSVIPGSGGTNLGKAEDGGHTTGDVGVMTLGVRNDALAAISGSDLDYTPPATDSAGRSIVIPFAPAAARAVGTATTTGTGDTSLVAASGDAGLRTYITDIIVANTGSATSLITFKDGNGGSTLGYTIAPAGGGSNLIHLATPIRTTANTAFYFAAATSSTTIYLTALGYKAP